MKFSVITLFPQLIEAFSAEGLLSQARERGLVEVETLNPRQFTDDVHHTVDDRAFGGSDGMVMKVEPLVRAIKSLPEGARVVVLSPQGRLWSQNEAKSWAAEDRHVVLVCGRYAGIDHRFTVKYADDEISLGDYVLNGGEVAALSLIESVARLIPGVLGNSVSAERDSFADGLLECPQFTRPREVEGMIVPSPLLSGHHAKISEFENAVALVRTALFRPDLVTGERPLGKSLALVRALNDDELFALGLTRDDLKELE